jgi:hypothetical protein
MVKLHRKWILALKTRALFTLLEKATDFNRWYPDFQFKRGNLSAVYCYYRDSAGNSNTSGMIKKMVDRFRERV